MFLISLFTKVSQLKIKHLKIVLVFSLIAKLWETLRNFDCGCKEDVKNKWVLKIIN